MLLGFYDDMAGRDVVPVRDWRNNVVSTLDVSTGLLLGHAEYTVEGWAMAMG